MFLWNFLFMKWGKGDGEWTGERMNDSSLFWPGMVSKFTTLYRVSQKNGASLTNYGLLIGTVSFIIHNMSEQGKSS